MSTKTSLKILFSCILLTLLIYTAWGEQPAARTAMGRAHVGTRSLLDDRNPDGRLLRLPDLSMFGCFSRKRECCRRIAWFIAIMLLGNMAMSAYVLIQLLRLRPEQEAVGHSLDTESLTIRRDELAAPPDSRAAPRVVAPGHFAASACAVRGHRGGRRQHPPFSASRPCSVRSHRSGFSLESAGDSTGAGRHGADPGLADHSFRALG